MAVEQCRLGRPRVAFSAMADGGAKRARVAEAAQTLQHLANEDADDLLEALCKRSRLETPPDEPSKLRQVMENIRIACENSTAHDKRQMLSLVAKIFPRSELKRYNFTCSESAYRTACEHADTLRPGAPVPQKIAPRSLTADQKKAVLDELKNNAPRAAPNRMVYTTNVETDERELRPVFYLEKPRASIYSDYRKRHGENAVSYTSFMKIVNKYAKEIKNLRRWTGTAVALCLSVCLSHEQDRYVRTLCGWQGGRGYCDKTHQG